MILLLGCAAESSIEVGSPPFDGYGTVSGTVVDAQTGSAISGATVYISGFQDLTQTTTDSSGNYTMSDIVPNGSRTVVASASGYNDATASATVTVGGTTSNVNLALLSTSYAANGYVIVLSWGDTPADLDAHITVPVVGYVISFTDPNNCTTVPNSPGKGDCDGTLDEAPFAGLDVDDQDKYGPETIKVALNGSGPSPYYSGTYKYYVHDWTNRAGTSGLSSSGANVKLYYNGTLVKSYDVPAGAAANEDYWQVFTIGSDGTITDVNTFSDNAPSV